MFIYKVTIEAEWNWDKGNWNEGANLTVAAEDVPQACEKAVKHFKAEDHGFQSDDDGNETKKKNIALDVRVTDCQLRETLDV